MKKEIKTDNGIYSYEEVELFLGRKIINQEISKINLLDFKKVMDKHKIRYGLMFGTLLGAIREGGFIPWDEDVDIFVLEEDRNKVFNALFDFDEFGFKVARYRKKMDLLSIIRDDEYIDMYFFRKTFNRKRREGNFEIDAKFLERSETIELFGEQFPVPIHPKQVLNFLYGEDWHIPKKDVKPKLNTFNKKVKNFIINKTPLLYKIYGAIRWNNYNVATKSKLN
jgi:lipopolysaccharide cholinephosphotransferase